MLRHFIFADGCRLSCLFVAGAAASGFALLRRPEQGRRCRNSFHILVPISNHVSPS